jgi:hypothetical protein
MISYLSQKVLIPPSVLLPLAALLFLSPTLYRLVVPARHAENVTNIGVDKILAPAKISLIFVKLYQSISMLTGLLLKTCENNK